MQLITYDNILSLFRQKKLYADCPVPDPKGRIRALTTPVTFLLGNGQQLTAEAGFEWDEQSVPWIGQPLFPKSGIYAPSALPHDIMYYLTVHCKNWVEEEFRRWMIATNLPPKQIQWRYWMVKKFGFKWWNKNLRNPGPRCLHNRALITLK